MVHRTRREQVSLVTEARQPKSQDIAYRERRYLAMMGIRVICFLAAILMFVSHAGWFSAIPAVAAIVIPYFAVVFANGGREPTSTSGFRPYEPNLPARTFQSQEGPGSSLAGGAMPPAGDTAHSPRHTPPHQDPRGH